MKTLASFLFILSFHALFSAQTKIDEYKCLISDDEAARLHHYSTLLKEDGNSALTLVIYKRKVQTPGSFLRHFYGVGDFLKIGASNERFSILFGGEADLCRTEAWLSKSEREIVGSDPKSPDEILRGKITAKTLFDTECIDCDPAVFINQFIFGKGLDYFARALKENSNTNALIEIAKVEYHSKTQKQRNALVDKILDVLIKKNEISRTRIKIKFKTGVSADFYIIPKIDKNKS